MNPFNPTNKVTLELIEVEKEETKLTETINETKQEIEYVDTVLKKYQSIYITLINKLQTLELQRQHCHHKRDKLFAEITVGSNSSIASSTTVATDLFKDQVRPSKHFADKFYHSNGLSNRNNILPHGTLVSSSLPHKVSSGFGDQCSSDSDNEAMNNLVAGLLKNCINEGGASTTPADVANSATPKSNEIVSESIYGARNCLSPFLVDGKIASLESSFAAAVSPKHIEIDSDNGWLEQSYTSQDSSPQSVSSQPSKFRTSFNQQNNFQIKPAFYNSVLALEASINGYVYKALNDGSVMRYRFGNQNDNQVYDGHSDKVRVLYLEPKLQSLFTGCDDGKIRRFNVKNGTLLTETVFDGNIVSIERLTEAYFAVATNKGWIYITNISMDQILSKHRTFNWIISIKALQMDKDRKNKLLVLPMKHKPSVIDAADGKILKEIGSETIESRSCVQINGSICILATIVAKSEPGKFCIEIFDSASEWKSIQKITKDGVCAALCTHGHDLYAGIKYPSFGHIQCYKWSNRCLSLKWVACVAYVHALAVLPSDIVLNGGPDGSVYNTIPNLKGPFFCAHKKCKCKLPFARRKDLEFHYNRLITIT